MTQDKERSSNSTNNLNLTVPLVLMMAFLMMQLWQKSDRLQASEQAHHVCQSALDRTDAVIDKLRNFNSR
ncbi:hypothetical protein [Nostoc sp. ChiQUE01b]|uniref:hypothetical protein n=1 Tax=Nostoc sp. ChiQUE01b TaxID=3075376 RepID=UPI002AD262D9|nr:hypothetical protein [Nostoc sp. ChiQUE01b]MDZ8260624.1 hypothetical protein [Nostoc sp. ChiQUE01b]